MWNSPRPELIVDEQGKAVGQVADAVDAVGMAGPFGRGRLVAALPLNGSGPQLISAARLLADDRSQPLGDPDGNVIGGTAAVWVHRLLTAQRTEDTRGL